MELHSNGRQIFQRWTRVPDASTTFLFYFRYLRSRREICTLVALRYLNRPEGGYPSGGSVEERCTE